MTRLDEQPFDLLLLDVSLPDRNGIDLLREIHQRDPVLPVVLITGWGLEPDAPPPENVAFVLSKPITMKALSEVLAACSVERPRYETGGVRCS